MFNLIGGPVGQWVSGSLGRWVGVGLFLGATSLAGGQTPAATAPGPLDLTIPSSAMSNFDHADFRLWLPPATSPNALQATVVLVPGSNGDGRGMVDDTVWQAFAVRHRVALIGVRFTDKPHDQNFIEDYVNVSHGSGQALLDAIDSLSMRTKHGELKDAPLFLWGMSAGGQFDYEFVAWKPERVAAFVVNKGGIYYTALTSRAARNVPGLLFIGGKDLESRIATITGLFALNRRGGALWALTEEPSAAHAVGRSRDLGAMFFEDVMALRFGEASPNGSPVVMKTLMEKDGYFGDIHAKTITPVGTSKAPATPTAWLPSLRIAKAWLAVVTETPFQ